MTQMAPSENLCFFQWEKEGLDELYEKYSSILRHATFVLSVIICVIGFIGNAIVIFATGFIMKKHQSKIWFLNLAIADFVFLLCLPIYAAAEFNENWSFGSGVCKMYNFLSTANMHVSIFIIMALSVDRTLAVAKPIWHHTFFSQRACYCICAAIWSVTVLASVPAIIFGAEIQSEGKTECSMFHVEDIEFHIILQEFDHRGQEDSISNETFTTFNHYFENCWGYQCCTTEEFLIVWNQWVSSVMCVVIPLLVIGYFIPLCVILASNIIIALKVRKSKSVKSSRLYRIIITVFIVHFLTWTPVFVVLLMLLVAGQNRNIILTYKLNTFLPFMSVLSFTSNCLNPIMYVLAGSQVRREFTGFLSRVRSSLSYHS